MKHPLHKLGKKNRNIISGVLVAVASIFLIAYYLDLPSSTLLRILGFSIIMVLGLMLMAIVCVIIIKGLARLFSSKEKPKNHSHSKDKP